MDMRKYQDVVGPFWVPVPGFGGATVDCVGSGLLCEQHCPSRFWV